MAELMVGDGEGPILTHEVSTTTSICTNMLQVSQVLFYYTYVLSTAVQRMILIL
jgi:hypothetical protein